MEKTVQGGFIRIHCNCIYFFWGLLLGVSNAAKWGNYLKKKNFINNAVETLIPFKKDHQDLLRPHVPVWKKSNAVSKRKNRFWMQKHKLWQDFTELLTFSLSVGGSLKNYGAEKVERIQKKDVLQWNVGNAVCRRIVKILWDSPCTRVAWKLLDTFGWMFGLCLIRFSNKTAEIRSLCI